MINHSPDLKAIRSRVAENAFWLKFPTVVLSKSPADPSQLCRYDIDASDVRAAFKDNRRQPAFDLWSMVIGVPPPVPGVSLHHGPLSSLKDAHACYVGIKRPIVDDDTGRTVLAYIVRPRFHFVYEPGLRSVAQLREFPKGLLFMICVRLDSAYSTSLPIPNGTVSDWAIVECDQNDHLLPRDHDKRFEERLW